MSKKTQNRALLTGIEHQRLMDEREKKLNQTRST